MAKKTEKYFLQFETKPSFAELDELFKYCLAYEPVFSTSYSIEIDPEVKQEYFPDIVHRLFKRYPYALCNLKTSGSVHRNFETPYIKTSHTHWITPILTSSQEPPTHESALTED